LHRASLTSYLSKKQFQQYTNVTILKFLIKSNYIPTCFDGGNNHHQGISEDFLPQPLAKQQNG
jgi:hypothetical protein